MKHLALSLILAAGAASVLAQAPASAPAVAASASGATCTATAAEKKLADEKTRLEEIARGELVSPWLDDALRAAGLPVAR